MIYKLHAATWGQGQTIIKMSNLHSVHPIKCKIGKKVEYIHIKNLGWKIIQIKYEVCSATS